MSNVESFTASVREGLAMILCGSGTEGRYLMFSCTVLIIFVRGWGEVQSGEVAE